MKCLAGPHGVTVSSAVLVVDASFSGLTLRMSRAPSRFSGASAPFACSAASSDRYRLQSHMQGLGLRNREVQFFETDDTAARVLHENDFLACFLADVFTRSLREPDGQGFALSVVEHLH